MHSPLGHPSRNLCICLSSLPDDLGETTGTVRVRGVTSYLNRVQRGLPDAHPALISDSQAILAMMHEMDYSADAVTRWVSRLTEVIAPLVTDNTILVCVPPSTPRLYLSGVRLVTLATAIALDIDFVDDGLIRTAPIGISTSRDRRDRALHQQSLAVSPAVAYRHVILVDDVLVSGTTMRAATELLLHGGAYQVDPVSLAQACTPDHGNWGCGH